MKRAVVMAWGLAVLLLRGLGLGVGLGQAQPSVPEELLALAEEVVGLIEEAQAEASLAWVAPTFADVQVSTQRMLNILVGQGGADYVAVGSEQQVPVGLLEKVVELGNLLADTAWADFVVTTDTLHTFLSWAQVQAKTVLELEDETAARSEIHKAEAFIRAALGCQGGLPTNGGAKTILQALGQNNAE